MAAQQIDTPKSAILISRCLLGVPCRYHGRKTTRWGSPIGRPKLVERLRRKYVLISVCPEVDAGLPVPRPPTRIIDGKWMCQGVDVTECFIKGAQIACDKARAHNCSKAILLRGSPACDRDGMAGRMLLEMGVEVRNI